MEDLGIKNDKVSRILQLITLLLHREEDEPKTISLSDGFAQDLIEALQDLDEQLDILNQEREVIKDSLNKVKREVSALLSIDLLNEPKQSTTPKASDYRTSVAVLSQYMKDSPVRCAEQEELVQKKEHYKWLFNNAGTVITVISLEGQFIAANRIGAALLGSSPEELVGRNIFDVFSAEYAKPMHDKIMDIAKSNEVCHVEQSNGFLTNQKWYATTMQLIDSEIFGVPCIYTVGQEITARKKIENELNDVVKELERANRDLQQFNFAAFHDFQEPLRSISTHLQLLKKKYEDIIDDEGKEIIAYVIGEAKWMLQMIRDFLQYSRVDSLAKPFETVDFNVAVDAAISNLATMIQGKEVVVKRDELPSLLAKQDQIVQLFKSLISNGINYNTNDLPEIHISSARVGNEWFFSVKDNGIGIDQNFKDRIFVPFQRLQGKKQSKGTGIGLTLSRKIVEHHKGRIWVESEVGKGSKFFFCIPESS